MKTLLRLLCATMLVIGRLTAATTPISGLPAASTVPPTALSIVVDTTISNPALQTEKATVSQLIQGMPDATTGSRGIMTAADKTLLANAASANTSGALVLRDISGNFGANNITANLVTGLAPPTNSSDAANKGYVDAAAAGLTIKTPAVAGTIGSNITLAGGAPNTLDGVTLHTNDRVLVKDQTAGTENGIYYVQTLGSGINGTWARTSDADTGAKLITGSYIFITGGTVNVNAAYTMVTPGAITIGTSVITWNLFSQITQIQASNILGQIVGSQIAAAAITTAKFASGITPVEIVSTLPTTSNFAGRTVFLTSDSKLYRYNGSAFTDTTATSDLTGTITTTQISDNSISTPKLQSNSVTSANIAAGAVTAGTIAANAVTSGTIAAGAVSTTELAAGAVTAAKIAAGTITASQIASNTITAGQIAAGTITADRLNISSLSAISANIGTITAGTINGVSITTTIGNIGGFTLASTGLSSVSGNYNASLNASVTASPGITLLYAGSTYATLTETTAGGVLQLGKSGSTNFIQLVGQTGEITSGGTVTGVNVVSTGSSTAAGWACRAGYGGTLTGNTFNLEFRGSDMHLWVDATDLGIITLH